MLCFIISRKVKITTETKKKKKICAVCEEGAVTDRMCQKWFDQFCAGDFSLDDASWWDRPVEVNSNQIKTLIKSNQHYAMQDTADIFKISISRVENHLLQLGYVTCLTFGSHLSEKYLLDCISACASLLKHNENVMFLKQIVMSNEK